MMPPLGWKTARPGPISPGKEKRSSSAPSLRWSRLGLFEAVQVRGEGLRRIPGRAVDALELRVLLVAAPVRARPRG